MKEGSTIVRKATNPYGANWHPSDVADATCPLCGTKHPVDEAVKLNGLRGRVVRRWGEDRREYDADRG